MNYGLYISAAGMQAQELRQGVISNNIANANTYGFKRDLAVMQARANAVDEDPRMAAYRLPVMEDQGGGVLISGGNGVDLTQAELQYTSSATDLALDGKGFFTVQGDKPGEKLLTRNGQFILNKDGGLVTANGNRPVLSADGEPIKLTAGLPVTIDASGKVTQSGAAGGEGGGGSGAAVQLGLVDVTDARRLIKLGGNVMTVDQPSALKAVSADTAVRQGQLESSGADPMVEMVNMMEGQRAFDANARMITFQDQTMTQLNQVGRVA